MKKYLTLILSLFCSICVLAQQQNEESGAVADKRNLIKLSPQQFFVKTFQIDYEIATGPRGSIQFSPSITAREDDTNKKAIGGGLEVTKKFYVGENEHLLEGFYAALSASFHHYNITEYQNCYWDPNTMQEICVGNKEEKINRYGANILFGHQFLIQQVVAIDLFFGGGIRLSDREKENNRAFDSNITDYYYTGVIPKIGFNVGLAF